MDQGMRTVILPAYNEEGFIAEMIDSTIKACEMRRDSFEIIVIDNASTDATPDIVSEISKKDSRVQIIRHPENYLYAASCLTGVRAARGNRIFIIDSDGQHAPADIWLFDEKMDEGYDIVFGWRRKREENLLRIMMSRAFLFLMRHYFKGFPFHDINCGIRGFKKEFGRQLDIRLKGKFVNPELFVRAKMGSFKMGEVSVHQYPRKAGKTTHILYHPWRLFKETNDYLASVYRIMNDD